MSEVDITRSQDWSALTVSQLEEAVKFHNAAYWLHDAPVIGDPDYDVLVETLRAKAPSSPVLDLIGEAGAQDGELEFEGEKVAHDPPMLSLDKCYDEDTLLKWFDKFEGDALVTPKIDGVAVCIRYDDSGRLATASTRGNGLFGELITEQVKRIVNVPERVPNGPAEFRGEAYMPWSVFRSKFAADYSSPRNLTAGALKQKDPENTRRYEIHFFTYDVIGRQFASEQEKMAFVESAGLTAVDHRIVPHAKLQETFEEFEELRPTFDYDTDGVVYKANATAEQARMGFTAHHPRYAIAYKFQGDSGQSTLREVLWSVSRTGAINPVGIVDPVELSGATVTRVSLHNLSIMEKLGGEQGLCIHSKVMMVRRGGVIPHLERVIEPGDEPIQIPTECPFCGAPTYRDNDVLTANHALDCRATRIKQIEHFASVMELKGFGPKILDALWDAELLAKPADFFNLGADELMGLDRVGRKTAENLVGVVNERRAVSAETFLRALGIDELGSHVAKILAREYGSIDEIFAVSREELAAIHTIGEVIAEKVTSGLAQYEPQIRELLEQVELSFPAASKGEQVEGELSGRSFLFTGALESMSRKAAQERVEALGGVCPSGVTRDLDYLVIGDADFEKFSNGWRTSKLKKADEYKASGSSIEVIGESTFLGLIGE